MTTRTAGKKAPSRKVKGEDIVLSVTGEIGSDYTPIEVRNVNDTKDLLEINSLELPGQCSALVIHDITVHGSDEFKDKAWGTVFDMAKEARFDVVIFTDNKPDRLGFPASEAVASYKSSNTKNQIRLWVYTLSK